jgi:2-methylcitrate dehydratase PrpD
VHGNVRLDAFSDARLTCADTAKLMEKIEIAVEPKLDATFPKQRAALVEIATTDGRTLVHEQTTRRGDPDSPLSDDELVGKFHELAGSAIGDGSRGLIDTLWAIDKQPSLELPLGSTGGPSRAAAE